MDSKERKLVIVLLTVSFSMMISGCFFVPFVVHIWTYLANLAGEKDVFLASILLIYFTMFALFGAALGLWLNAYCCGLLKAIYGGVKKLVNRLMATLQK
jgi:hypothetical protein